MSKPNDILVLNFIDGKKLNLRPLNCFPMVISRTGIQKFKILVFEGKQSRH